MQKKRILICGAGSIGVYIGTKLHLRKHDVKLFGRRKLQKVKEKILIDGKEYKVPEKLFRLPKHHKPDFILITTKLYDFEPMINLIKKNKLKYSLVATVQNGFIDISKHSKVLGHKIIPINVFSGFNLVGNEIIVKPTKIGWVTENSPEGKKVSAVLFDAGIPCHPKKSFDSLRAEKLIVNCCLNALSAIEKKPFRDLFKNKRTKKIIENLFDECYKILEKSCKLDNYNKMKKRMFQCWSNLNHYSSTYQDIQSGRKNEIPYFNGHLIKLGKKYGLPVEYNQEIFENIKRISQSKF